MTSRDIVQYFEDRGFLANYWYDEKHRGILFVIHKGGNFLSGTLYYTEDPIQFASGMVKRFAERYYQKEGENKWTYITSASPNYKNRFQEECIAYCKHDVESIREIKKTMTMSIKDVIFNDPATIVFWMDGTKTVVKCQEGDTFDPEKGLAMAIVKKIHGNKSSYCNEIKKWTEKYRVSKESVVDKCIRNIIDAMKKNGCTNIYLDGKEV